MKNRRFPGARSTGDDEEVGDRRPDPIHVGLSDLRCGPVSTVLVKDEAVDGAARGPGKSHLRIHLGDEEVVPAFRPEPHRITTRR